jgi:hypothetical protein
VPKLLPIKAAQVRNLKDSGGKNEETGTVSQAENAWKVKCVPSASTAGIECDDQPG